MSSLVSWARDDAHIYPPNFDCRYYTECNDSVGGSLWRGSGCLMSYVGREYGSSALDDGFRLVIVGIDHGGKGGGTFAERREEVEGYHQLGKWKFNPHYKGVVKTIAAVFGRTGDYCRENCIRSCQQSRHLDATHCVIDRIVQPNNVKCTPKDTVNATSRASWRMKANCAHHLASELKLLKPHLVVFHGAAARWVALPELQKCGLEIEPVEAVEPVTDQTGHPVLYECATLDAHMLFFNHPSRGWLDRQWDGVVVPALDHLRRRKLIPASGVRPAMEEINGTHNKKAPFEAQAEQAPPESGDAIADVFARLTPVSTMALTRSSDFRSLTRDAIGNVDVLRIRDGHLYLRNASSALGAIAEADLSRNVLRVVDRQSGDETTFASVDALIEAGWLID